VFNLDYVALHIAAAQPAQVSASSPSTTASSSSTESTASPANWTHFRVPDDTFSPELKKQLTCKERLEPRARRELVRKVVDEALKMGKRPVKKELDQVAAVVRNKYPESLTDVLDGAVIGSGHSSLTLQLVSRVENVHRSVPSSFVRRKRVNKETKELRVIDGLGCANYEGELPEGENAESQAGHKEALQLLFQRGQWHEDEVVQLCSLSYYTQRKDINSMMTVAVLVVEWPFLFKEQHFFNHAQELLGFNVEDRLNSALQNKGTRLITFFRSEKSTCKSMRLVNQLIEGHHGSLLPAVLMGLMAYFKEDSNCTLIAAEVSECFSAVVWLLPPKSLCSSLCYL